MGGDEEACGLWILLLPHLVPPPSNTLDGKGRGIVVAAHIHPARIASQVVHPVRRRSPQALDGEIVDPYFLRFSLPMPSPPRVLTIPHQFTLLLLCVLWALTVAHCTPPASTRQTAAVVRRPAELPPQPSDSAWVAANSRRVRSVRPPAIRT